MTPTRTRTFITTLRSVLTRPVRELGATNFFLLFVLATITIYPLFSGGFTTHDDAWMAINVWNGLTWEITKSASFDQGRFVFLWAFPLSAVPFIIDDRLWYLAFKFGSFFVLLGAIYYAVFQSFRSQWIALTALAFFLAIIQNGWEHNALTSFALVFNTYATLFLVSLGLFATAINRKSLALAVLSGVLYFVTCASELFVLFFPFYVAVLLSRVAPGETLLVRLKSGKKYIFAIALPLIAYLTLYLVWRQIYPSTYDGNQLNVSNPLAVGKVIATYSLTAFPLASLSRIYSALSDPLPFANPASLHAILAEFNALHVIKPIVVGFLFARLMTAERFVVPSGRKLLIGAAVAWIGIFLPNLLLGFSKKYQSWVESFSHSYVYTYYSLISAVVFLALLLAYMNAKSRAWHPRLRLAVVSLVVAAMMSVSFAVELRNQYFAFEQKLAHRKWQLMEVLVNSPAFMEIPEGTTVVAPTLVSHHRDHATVSADDWSNYVKYKTGKHLRFDKNKCKSGDQCYQLVFRQAPQSDNQFVILQKTKHIDSLTSTALTIYSMPTQTNAVIVGSFIPGKLAAKLEMNGKPLTNVGSGVFSSMFPADADHGLAQTVSMAGNVEIIPEQIIISPYSVEPRLRPLADE